MHLVAHSFLVSDARLHVQVAGGWMHSSYLELAGINVDVVFVDDDDAIVAFVESIEQPQLPGGAGGSRPFRDVFTRTYLAGDMQLTRYARLRVILDDVELRARARNGVDERARERRRAAVALAIDGF